MLAFFFLFNILGTSLSMTSRRPSSSWKCYNKYCYWSDGIVRAYASLAEAQKVCKEADAKSWLLEIYDDAVNGEVSSFMGSSPAISEMNVLLNLKRVDTEWRWTDGTSYNGQSKYDPAKNNDKVMFYVDKPFATLRSIPFRGIYGPTFVTSLLNNYICSFDGVCEAPFVTATNSATNKKCYKLMNSNDPINWFQAYNLCHKKGGKLASLGDLDSKTLQTTFANAKSFANYWIGLFNSQWNWQHNSASISNFTNWYTGYPYPNFLGKSPEQIQTIYDYRDGGVWMDNAAHEQVAIVCMKDKSSTSSSPR